MAKKAEAAVVEPTEDPSEVSTKWVLQSKTVWGVVIAFVTAVLPTINLVLGHWGISIDPSWLPQVDGYVQGLISSVGGLIGLGLVIWSRWQVNKTKDSTNLSFKKPVK